MKNIKWLLYVLCAICLITACSEDEIDIPDGDCTTINHNGVEQRVKTIKITKNDFIELIGEFTYDGNLVSEIYLENRSNNLAQDTFKNDYQFTYSGNNIEIIGSELSSFTNYEWVIEYKVVYTISEDRITGSQYYDYNNGSYELLNYNGVFGFDCNNLTKFQIIGNDGEDIEFNLDDNLPILMKDFAYDNPVIDSFIIENSKIVKSISDGYLYVYYNGYDEVTSQIGSFNYTSDLLTSLVYDFVIADEDDPNDEIDYTISADYNYNANNYLTSEEYNYDVNFPGNIEYKYEYTYENGKGNVSSFWLDFFNTDDYFPWKSNYDMIFNAANMAYIE